jgi:hypothetical protein
LPEGITRARADDPSRCVGGERSRCWGNPSESARAARFHLRSRERLRDGLAFAGDHLLGPPERLQPSTSSGWEFLYPIARPLRLLRKYSGCFTEREAA